MLNRSSPTPARRTARRLRTAVVAATLAAGVAAPLAHAAVDPVVSDCVDDGKLDKTYSAAQYTKALKNIPTDADEYTDCRDVIKRAALGLGGSGGKGTGGSSHGGSGGGSTGGTSTGSGGAGAAAGTGTGGPTGAGLTAYDDTLKGASDQERQSIAKATGSAPGSVEVNGRQLRADSLGHGNLGSLNSLPAPLVVVLILLSLGAIAAGAPKIRALVRSRLQRTA